MLADAKKMYTKYDADGTNDIDKSELVAMLKELNLRLDQEMYEKLVDVYWKEADEDVRYG